MFAASGCDVIIPTISVPNIGFILNNRPVLLVHVLIEAQIGQVAVICMIRWFTGLPVAQTDQDQTHLRTHELNNPERQQYTSH